MALSKAKVPAPSLQDWRDIMALLDTALDLEPEARTAWLAALGLEHDRLTPLLEELLRDHVLAERSNSFRAPEIFAARSHPSLEPQSIVGPYRLLYEIGQGGMASVWLAERADGLLERQVALKLPHVGWGSGSLAERMARERNILASLTHPNIARLYDAGIDISGRPFLALEYIDGQPIDTYASARGLGVRARLGLLVQVARAVAHAHGQLIVHRDLKPSNILVDAQGQVHLLDFGIAKLVDPLHGDAAGAAQLTQAGDARALTPDYASPEQIRGEALGTASDVYSLGVVAYELLAETKPYCLPRDGAAALAQALAALDVPRASSAAASLGTRRDLQGDLDAILNKALKKEATERYASAEAFAQDIQRHLASQPVLARPDAPGYRIRKFLQRNKLPVAAMAAVSVSLIAGLSVALWQAREALHQADRAQRVKEFIGTVFAAADPHIAGKAGATVRDLLDTAATRIERELKSEPAVAAELLGLLAESYRNLGELDQALSAAQRANGLAAQSYAQTDAMRPRLMRILAQAQIAKGQGDEARRLLNAAVAMQRQQGSEPGELGQSLLALSSAVEDEGRELEAVALAREAVRQIEAAYGSENALTIRARGELSNKLMIAGQPPEALLQAERAVQSARRAFVGPEHPALVEQLSNYAYALDLNGRRLEAREQWQVIVAADRKIFNPRGPQVSDALVALGQSQGSLGELKDALASLEESLAMLQALGVRSGGELAIRHFTLGRLALQARQGERATSRLDEAIVVGTQTFGASSARVRDAGYYRAEALLRAGRLVETGELTDRLIAEDRGSGAPGLARALRIRGLLEQARGDAASALTSLKEADSIGRPNTLGGPNAPAQLRAELGRAQLEAGQLLEAENSLRQAIDELRRLEPTATPRQAEAWLALGRVRLRQGRLGEALSGLHEADAFWRAFDPEHDGAGEAAFWLGRGQAQAGDKQAARAQLARARALLEASTWPVLRQLAQHSPA